jgi:hypothetical protein
VTVSKRFMEKVEAARDALSHSHPGADVERKPQPASGSRRGPPRGLPPGRRALPMADGWGRHLRLHPPGRARPHRPIRARRQGDRRQLESPMRSPQRPRRSTGLRRRVHAAVQAHPRCERPPAGSAEVRGIVPRRFMRSVGVLRVRGPARADVARARPPPSLPLLAR